MWCRSARCLNRLTLPFAVAGGDAAMKHLTCIAAACLIPGMGLAQDAGDSDGGVQLRFDISQRFEVTSNRNLNSTDQTPGRDSTTNLTFGFSDETRTQAVSLDLSTGLRLSEDGTDVSDPSATFGYTRSSANAALTLDASWTRSDIAYLRDLQDFVDADGVLVLPDDLDDLNGSGTRTIQNYGAGLRWGTAGPAEYALDLDLRRLRYDGANASLTDADTTRLGLGLRLNITPVTTARVNLSYSLFDQAGSDVQKTAQASTGLTFDQPSGKVSAQITANRAADGALLWGASLGRSFDLPTTSLSARLGLTENLDGAAVVTGDLSYTQRLPEGQISLSAQQGLTAGGANDGRRNTTVQAGYTQTLSPLSNMQLGFDYAQTRDIDASYLANGSFSASYGMRLTPDWQLNLGARLNLRDDGSDRTRSQSVFVGLDRSFAFRP